MTTRPPTSNPSPYFLSNRLGRIIMLSAEESFGRTALKAILNLAGMPYLINNYPPNNLDRRFNFDELSQLLRALETMYGPSGSRSLSLRMGQAVFRNGLKELGTALGTADLAFRLLPLSLKLRLGLESITTVLNEYSDAEASLEETVEEFILTTARCAICWQRQAARPIGFMMVGTLQEGLYWVSGGRSYDVEETSCIATGQPVCHYRIIKRALNDIP
mgnify:CR=1 FL=1